LNLLGTKFGFKTNAVIVKHNGIIVILDQMSTQQHPDSKTFDMHHGRDIIDDANGAGKPQQQVRAT
jgi:hypothetical protein